MPLLIDGHNLIPKAGLQLASADDELELIPLLQVYCRQHRTQVEVYFDAAPPSNAGSRKFGAVTAHFISERSTADAAIKARLAQLGGAAKNWTVVSSDGEVRRAAAAARARLEKSEHFARRLRVDRSAESRHEPGRVGNSDGGMSDEEVRRWLDIFRKR